MFDGIRDAPGLVVEPVGAFADASFPAPASAIYEDRAHSWVAVETAAGDGA